MDRMLRIECMMRGYHSQFNHLDEDFWGGQRDKRSECAAGQYNDETRISFPALSRSIQSSFLRAKAWAKKELRRTSR